MLANFSKGISNTSTTKYDAIKAFVAAELGLKVDEVYATGAGGRMSNLDTRLAQGNQRNQHTPLALAFYKADAGQDRAEVLSKAASSFTNTALKFVDGRERGTTFDGILGLVQIDGEKEIIPLKLLSIADASFRSKLLSALPSLAEQEVTRIADPAASISAIDSEATAVKTSREPAKIDSSLIKLCESALKDAGLRFPDGLVARYVASLMAKRFVILAGLAGSGKTKLALAFAKWLAESDEQVELVAVGADWTSNENVLGYRDAIDPSKYRRPANGALDIILKAAEDTQRPYFLILDEMNLSHVECYFADLLSAIESGEQLALHSGTEDVDGVPPRVRLPRNLFIVGTVNVDETAYTFSPKVLDRANVIEFRTGVADIRAFLDNPGAVDLRKIEGVGHVFGPALISAIDAQTALSTLPPEIAKGINCQEQLQLQLTELFELLAPLGAEFGFRTAMEILRFTYFHALIVGDEWRLEFAVDAQLLQKLLPKLHGSERRLRPVLERLRSYSTAKSLKLSGEKLGRMEDRLRDGFASFLH